MEKEINRKLIFRESAKNLFQKIIKTNYNKVNLDFKNVDFMSRSFAQEYIYQRGNKNLEITEKNLSPFVEGLLNVVEHDYIKHSKKRNIDKLNMTKLNVNQ
jgi:hypothetical protein